MQRMHATLVGSIVLSTCAVAMAAPPEVYATNHMGNWPTTGTDTLIKFYVNDPANFETIGPLSVPDIGFGGLEFDAEGNLWAYASFSSWGGAAAGLYLIDTETGQATVQGTLSSQTLTDLAYNPVNDTMYGVFSQGYATPRLYTVDLETGEVSVVGTFTGMDAQNNLVGIGIDSTGTIYVFDNINNKLYKSDENLNLTLMYESDLVAVGSQGIAVDWSRNDTGYHGTVGQGEFPNYYNNVNTFALDGSSYFWGPDFGPNNEDGTPQVQPGDLAIVPADTAPKTPGDLNGDGVVNVSDLLLLLADWGNCECDADLNDDGVVNVSDLLLLLSHWG